jgi:hypothetical protein
MNMRYFLTSLTVGALLCGACGDDGESAREDEASAGDASVPENTGLRADASGAPQAPSVSGDASAATTSDAATNDSLDAGLDAAADASLDAAVAAEFDAGIALTPPVSTDASDTTDAGSSRDASPLDGGLQLSDAQADAAPDLGDAASAPDAALLSCPADVTCPLEAHPCVPSDDGQGYQCQGQVAVWPMPEKVRDAKAAPNYTVMTAQRVVLDEVTGLLWERVPPESYPGCSGTVRGIAGASCTYAEAELYCQQLQLAGKRWRIPSKIELESLLDFVSSPLDQVLDLDAFPSSQLDLAASLWSSTDASWVEGDDAAYRTNFRTGLTGRAARDTFERVRCVHAARVTDAPPGERYVAEQDGGVVRDRHALLEWQRGMSSTPFDTVAAASAYCAERGDGFRLPTYKELLTLYDLGQPDLPLSPLFESDLSSHWLWSSTVNQFGDALTLHWVLGLSLPAPSVQELQSEELAMTGMSDNSVSVRCVR